MILFKFWIISLVVSSNAINFLDTKIVDKKIKCFCVGIATEKTAKSAGFQNIISAEGNVRNLKELILQNFRPSDGNIVYVSGQIISSDLDQELINKGYTVKRIINYKTNHNLIFEDGFIAKLKTNMPDDDAKFFDTLSMGMSADYPEAIKYGDNIVRVGSKLFA